MIRLQSIPKFKDVRNTLHKHKTKRYGSVPLSMKDTIILHHSATLTGSAESYARYHVDTNGWAGIAYHFVIEKDGTVKYCNDLTTVSYHSGNSNTRSVGVNLTGDFRYQEPTDAQYTSLFKLIPILVDILNIKDYKKVIGHQEAPTYLWKQCPAIDMDSLRGYLSKGTIGKVKNNFNNDAKILIDVPQVMKSIVPADGKVYWKGLELRKGQTGIVTVTAPINLWTLNEKGKLEEVRILYPNEMYRTYGFNSARQQYDVGGNYWITKMDTHIKYETPSKSKLDEVNGK